MEFVVSSEQIFRHLKNDFKKFQNFRIQLDKKREMFDYLSEEEKQDLKESLRLFRNPFERETPLGEKYYNNVKNNPFRFYYFSSVRSFRQSTHDYF